MIIEDKSLHYIGSKNVKRVDLITQCKTILTYVLHTQKHRQMHTHAYTFYKTFNFVKIETAYMDSTRDRKCVGGFTTIGTRKML